MKFKLLQWNILYTEPLDQVAAVIEQINPDVACLQELSFGYWSPDHDSGAELAQRLGMTGFYQYDPLRMLSGETVNLGNGVFSRFPMSNKRELVLATQSTPEGRVLSRYSYIEGQVTLPSGAKLSVGTLHPPFNPRLGITPTKKLVGERLLAALPATGTVIVAGDFNATPGSAFMKTVRQQLRSAGPNLAQKSWTRFPQDIGPNHFEGLNWRIDYVLYQGSIKPKNSQILSPKISDHLPVVVEFGTA